MMSSLTSCRNLDDIKGRLDNLEVSVSNLEAAVKALQDAYTKGKFIQTTSPITDTKAGGWLISFTDNSEIRITNGENGYIAMDGKDGLTPYLKVDSIGCWSISYDNGSTFEDLLDDDGNKILAVGKDGRNGAEGYSARVKVGSNGNYVIQTYKESAPTVIIEEIATSFTSKSQNVISAIVQNDRTMVTSIQLADGSTYYFNRDFTSPKNFVLLSNQTLNLSYGTQTSLEFRVNPSNAYFSLDKIGLVKVNSSGYSVPSGYKLIRIEDVYDDKGREKKVGQYRAIIEDTKGELSYEDQIALSMTVYNEEGKQDQIISSSIGIKNKNNGELIHTDLPVVVIKTPNAAPVVSKETWMAGATITIINPDMSIDYEGTMSIKGRGNSTWNYPKKPFALKLDKKDKILGMKKHKRWCLLANWIDRTMIRNAVAFEISKKTGLAWTPSGKHVEVVFNGKHLGNYYLCEQIKVDENRVNISSLDPAATSGDGITGGYIFEIDDHYDEAFKFKSTICQYPWMFKDPDEINTAQFNYVVNYVNELESSLYDAGRFAARDFTNYLNLESFVDFWFVYELTMNADPNMPRSVYMHKDIGGKMTAGPVWDFDFGTFKSYMPTYTFRIKDAVYYKQLFKDPQFVALVKERWQRFKPAFENDIPAFIDAKQNELSKSEAINYKMWPINRDINDDETMTFPQSLRRLKASYLAKLTWLDTQINAM